MALWTRKASLAIGCGHLLLGTLLGCGTMPQNRSWPESRSEQAIVLPSVVQSLQRQVRDRDRRIAELTFQLEALKTIRVLETTLPSLCSGRSKPVAPFSPLSWTL
jgi:hypothetical protein